MTGRGRPQVGSPAVVRLPPDMLAVVDRIATDRSMKRAEVLRMLIDLGLQHIAKPD
jgi:hypothetical protein